MKLKIKLLLEIEKVFQCKKCLKIFDDENGRDFKIGRIFKLKKKSNNFNVIIYFILNFR